MKGEGGVPLKNCLLDGVYCAPLVGRLGFIWTKFQKSEIVTYLNDGGWCVYTVHPQYTLKQQLIILILLGDGFIDPSLVQRVETNNSSKDEGEGGQKHTKGPADVYTSNI